MIFFIMSVFLSNKLELLQCVMMVLIMPFASSNTAYELEWKSHNSTVFQISLQINNFLFISKTIRSLLFTGKITYIIYFSFF